MSKTKNWEFESTTLGQVTVTDQNLPKFPVAANRTIDLPTEPNGVYEGVDTIEKHQNLVHHFGGRIKFSTTK